MGFTSTVNNFVVKNEVSFTSFYFPAVGEAHGFSWTAAIGVKGVWKYYEVTNVHGNDHYPANRLARENDQGLKTASDERGKRALTGN